MNIIKYSVVVLSLWGLLPLFCNGQHYYAPNEGLIIPLNKKNDLKTSLALGSNTVLGRSFSYQLGYSPVKHLGIQSSYAALKTFKIEDQVMSSYIANAAIGAYYFLPLKKADLDHPLPQSKYLQMHQGFMIDLYAGYAKGETSNQHTILIQSELDFSKSFIQGGLHWQGKLTGLDFVVKTGVLNYESAVVSGSKERPISEVNNIIFYNSYNFIESSLRFQFGVRQARFFFTQTWMKISYKDKIDIIDNAYNFGVLFNVNEFFKKRGN